MTEYRINYHYGDGRPNLTTRIFTDVDELNEILNESTDAEKVWVESREVSEWSEI